MIAWHPRLNPARKRRAGIFDDLAVGHGPRAKTRTVTEADIVQFADVSGDHNPVHLDAAYAATTMFKERIAHGMLAASFISAMLANDMPGCRARSMSGQTLKFKAPVQDRRDRRHKARARSRRWSPEKKFATSENRNAFVGDKSGHRRRSHHR